MLQRFELDFSTKINLQEYITSFEGVAKRWISVWKYITNIYVIVTDIIALKSLISFSCILELKEISGFNTITFVTWVYIFILFIFDFRRKRRVKAVDLGSKSMIFVNCKHVIFCLKIHHEYIGHNYPRVHTESLNKAGSG